MKALNAEIKEMTSLHDFIVISFVVALKPINQLQDPRPLIHITEKYEYAGPNHIMWSDEFGTGPDVVTPLIPEQSGEEVFAN